MHFPEYQDIDIYEDDILGLAPTHQHPGKTEELTRLQASSYLPEETISIDAKSDSFEEGIFAPNAPKKNSHESRTNLLKNLVVTVRTWVRFDHYPQSSPEVILWAHLKKSNRLNKHLILSIFANQESAAAKYPVILESLGLTEKQLPLPALITAHQHIRAETVKQLEEADVEFVLKNRRVKNREEFSQYFYKFLQCLKHGGISHRRH